MNRRPQLEICRCPLPEACFHGSLPARAPIPAAALPALSSLPGASKKLYLDFNGRTVGNWFFYTGVVAQPFVNVDDADVITEIWQRVAEDYSLWNLDVTTVEPESTASGDTAIICIGGSYSDWYGSAAGGVAAIGGYTGFGNNPNVGFVFANNLSNVTKNVAEAASHEAGHLFGLRHQSLYDGESLVSQYNPGSGDWAPIMGNSYSAGRSTWHNGPNDQGFSSFQNDLAVISAKNFGLRSDDYADSIETAEELALDAGAFSVDGVLQEDDADVWAFTCGGGEVNATLSGGVGANTNLILELRNSAGDLIAISAPSDSYNASIQETVSAGQYALLVYGSEDYGWLGQYTLSGTVPLMSSGIRRSGRLFRRSA